MMDEHTVEDLLPAIERKVRATRRGIFFGSYMGGDIRKDVSEYILRKFEEARILGKKHGPYAEYIAAELFKNKVGEHLDNGVPTMVEIRKRMGDLEHKLSKQNIGFKLNKIRDMVNEVRHTNKKNSAQARLDGILSELDSLKDSLSSVISQPENTTGEISASDRARPSGPQPNGPGTRGAKTPEPQVRKEGGKHRKGHLPLLRLGGPENGGESVNISRRPDEATDLSTQRRRQGAEARKRAGDRSGVGSDRESLSDLSEVSPRLPQASWLDLYNTANEYERQGNLHAAEAFLRAAKSQGAPADLIDNALRDIKDEIERRRIERKEGRRAEWEARKYQRRYSKLRGYDPKKKDKSDKWLDPE